MIKGDVKGLITIKNIRIIKKPLNHLTPLIYFKITLFGHGFKVTECHLLPLIVGSAPTMQQKMFLMDPLFVRLL